jgi:methyl-accepting chemotaxis protein
MLKNITIKSLLLFVMGLLSMLLVGTGVLGLTSLDTTNKALQSVYDDRTVPIGELNTVITSVMMNQIDLSGSIYGNPDLIIPKMDAIETRSKKADTAFAAYIATDLTPEEKIAADKFAAARKLYLEKALRPAVEASRGGNVLRVTEIVNGPMEELFTPVRTSVSDLIDIQLHEAKLLYDSSQHRFALVRNISIAAILFGVAVAAFMAFWLVRLIARPLHEAVRIAKSVAAGDLTQRIDVQSTNETGQLLQALKDMNDSLSRTVSTVRHGTETITVASSEIATGNADLSSRTESQAGSLEETASSMEELTSTVRQNADNARQANQLVLTASEVAIKGGSVVSQVVDTMGSINQSSKKIVDIISVIDSIAFQTNILALNAAVEAARAGEQGRGFAVVASEVRSLAQRSAGAAKEIKELIGDSVSKVDAGSKLVDEAGVTMEEIVSSVKRVADIMSEITAASQEQSSGLDQINQAITQMDEITQQNAALVEEAAAAAQSLQDQATDLSRAVSIFRINDQTLLATATQAKPPALAQPQAARITASAPKAAVPAAVAPKPIARPAPAKKPALADGDDGWEEF